MTPSFITRFLKSSMIVSVGTVLTLVFHFLTVTLLTRYVSELALGLYFLVLATALFLKIFANLGLDISLVKFLANENQAEKEEMVTIILILRLVMVLLFAGLVYLFGDWVLPLLGDGLEPFTVYIPFIFIGHSLRELLLYLLQGLKQFKHMAIVRTASASMKFLLFLLFRNQLTLTTLLTVEFGMLGVSLLLQVWFIPFKALGISKLNFNKQTAKKVLKFGLPLYISSLVTSLGGNSAIFIINFYLNPIGIAFYEIAQKIPEGVDGLLGSLETVYFPNLAELFAKGKVAEAVAVVNKTAVLLSILLTNICVGTFLFGEEILRLVFSERYASLGLALTLSMVTITFAIIANIFGYTLVSAEKPQTSPIVNSLTIGTFIIGNLILVPRFGFIGAIISGLIADLFDVLLYSGYMVYYRIAPSLLKIFQPLVFGALFCLLIFASGVNTFAAKAISMIIFASLCLLFSDLRDVLKYLPSLKQQLLGKSQQTVV